MTIYQNQDHEIHEKWRPNFIAHYLAKLHTLKFWSVDNCHTYVPWKILKSIKAGEPGIFVILFAGRGMLT